MDLGGDLGSGEAGPVTGPGAGLALASARVERAAGSMRRRRSSPASAAPAASMSRTLRAPASWPMTMVPR
jgi:hypothetical protein